MSFVRATLLRLTNFGETVLLFSNGGLFELVATGLRAGDAFAIRCETLPWASKNGVVFRRATHGLVLALTVIRLRP